MLVVVAVDLVDMQLQMVAQEVAEAVLLSIQEVEQ
jgi:hypothetical protein